MKLVPGTDLLVPDYDEHFCQPNPKKKGRAAAVGYQEDRLLAAYRHVRHWGTAVDVGAHVGLLSRKLAERFAAVLAFEPHPETFACLQANTKAFPRVKARQVALGARSGVCLVDPAAKANTGDRRLLTDPEAALLEAPGQEPPAPDDVIRQSRVSLLTLDSLKLPALGLLKIDVQGYELAVLKGGLETLRRCRPVCIVECEDEGGNAPNAFGIRPRDPLRLLLGLGAMVVATLCADRIVVFPHP